MPRPACAGFSDKKLANFPRRGSHFDGKDAIVTAVGGVFTGMVGD